MKVLEIGPGSVLWRMQSRTTKYIT